MKILTDADKIKFADAITGRLMVQTALALEMFNASMDDERNLKPKALGYVYGWVDAALDHQGYNMNDMEIAIPILYRVLYNLFPKCADRYMEFLIENLKMDPLVYAGMMHGGQQFIDYSKQNVTGGPTGLARFIAE